MNANIAQQESLCAKEHSTFSKQGKPPPICSTRRGTAVCTNFFTVDSYSALTPHLQSHLQKPSVISELCSFELKEVQSLLHNLYWEALLLILDGVPLLLVLFYVTVYTYKIQFALKVHFFLFLSQHTRIASFYTHEYVSPLLLIWKRILRSSGKNKQQEQMCFCETNITFPSQ